MSQYRQNNYSPRGCNSNWNKSGGQGYNRKGPGNNAMPVTARAPYNFIPYEPDAVLAHLDDKNPDRWSGVIRCSLTALTPLLISSEQKKEKGCASECRFFEVDGKAVIPGTSIKGMLRSLVEILSFSYMRPVGKKQLFWRMVNCPDYRRVFPQEKIMGGYVKRNGASYTLIPVTVVARKHGVSACEHSEIVKTGGFRTRGVSSCDYIFHAPAPNQKVHQLNKNLIDTFMAQLTDSQKSRWRDMDQRLAGKKHGLPVFYRTDEAGEIVELGLCRYFRRAYTYTPSDLCRHDNAPDIATRIFGSVNGEHLKGKVAVAPAVVEGKLAKEEGFAVILGEPRPTCLAHYLDQSGAKIKTYPSGKNNPETLTRYDTLTDVSGNPLRLRGRKWYWHHDVKIEQPQQNSESVQSRLFPLSKDASACIEIRVHSVSTLELGALLEALDLPEGHAHKLGMGKPLGFGSIRLEVEEVAVQKTSNRYASLVSRFEDSGEPLPKETWQGFKNSFREEILHNIREKHRAWKNVTSYDNLPPISDLRLMMDFNKRPDPEKVRYLDLKEYGSRQILPYPRDVLARK